MLSVSWFNDDHSVWYFFYYFDGHIGAYSMNSDMNNMDLSTKWNKILLWCLVGPWAYYHNKQNNLLLWCLCEGLFG